MPRAEPPTGGIARGPTRAASPDADSSSLPQRMMTPRSLARHHRRSRAMASARARRLWKLVRSRLREVVGVMAADVREGTAAALGDGYESHLLQGSPRAGLPASVKMWGAALGGWQTRSAEKTLRALPQLQPISEAEIHALLEHTSISTYPRYTQVYRKGGRMSACHVLLQGELRIAGSRDEVASVPAAGGAAGGSVGEGGGGSARGRAGGRRVVTPVSIEAGGAWLEEALHTDTSTALTPCVLLTIRAADAKRDPRLVALSARLASSLGSAWLETTLTRYVTLFCDLPRRSLATLAPLFRPLVVEGGTVVIREGELAEEVYVLVQGEVSVFRSVVDGVRMPVELTRISDASEFVYFGELALHYRRPRSASVRAEGLCFLLKLNAADFPVFTSLVRRHD